tara:strand:- start:33028 stop:33330 length:303 start_codon:yes stop_codon:yes gene_type:complete
MSGLRWYGITLQYLEEGIWHDVPHVDPEEPEQTMTLDPAVYVENIDGLGKGDAVDLEKEDIANVGDLLNVTAAQVLAIVGQNGLDAIVAYLAARGAKLKA